MKLPLRTLGQTVVDADGRVIVSAFTKISMEERRQIVAAVNATAKNGGAS